MPFDPKLVQQAEAPLTDAGDLQLPDDLLELAAQLGDDARHLAQVYPAHQPCEEKIGLLSAVSLAEAGERGSRGAEEKNSSHLTLTSGRLMRAVALVASLAAVAIGIAVWYPRDNAPEPIPRNIAEAPPTANVAHTEPQPPSTISNPQSPISNPLSPSPPLPPPPAPAPPASRETFLHEYSGPELEGLYDLIGDAEEDTISI